MAHSFPTPKFITGGCFCDCLRYRVDFPQDHNFQASSNTCQCTHCRKQTGSLFVSVHMVTPASTSFYFITDTRTLQANRINETAEYLICKCCGSFICWRLTSAWTDLVCFTVGTVDPLYLFGEGADGVEVPWEGFGMALANGGGTHLYCMNEIRGVTDEIEILGR
ncbi:uncharacterized protein B0T15DRAFT_552908 [Chaetomium strumarium]|uniref:CENP-V/GFA domain-containing protein n=1 Tax=Chaetomium strumarium TaxID=1170767 RepID=A0AAJ0GVW6_9PEZI|nr:hypothetical protein B0T15DRAFT_552908 [Chaetomium strumarium]